MNLCIRSALLREVCFCENQDVCRYDSPEHPEDCLEPRIVDQYRRTPRLAPPCDLTFGEPAREEIPEVLAPSFQDIRMSV